MKDSLDSAVHYYESLIMVKPTSIEKMTSNNYAKECDIDNVDKNMMLVTYDQKLWYPSLYDLDTTFGTEWDGKNVIDYSFIPENGDSLLWNRFIDIFKDELAASIIILPFLFNGEVKYS